MTNYWVIKIKAKASTKSSLPQDGSDFYYARSVVPADSKGKAIESLSKFLEKDFMQLEEVLETYLSDSSTWESGEDEDFETVESIERSKASGNISLGCFISESSLE